MNPDDPLDQYRQLSKQMAAHRAPYDDLVRSVGAQAKLYEEVKRSIIPLDSTFLEASRIASGQLNALKSAAASAHAQMESLRQAQEFSTSMTLLKEASSIYERQFRLATQSDWLRVSDLAKQISTSPWVDQIAKMHTDIERQLSVMRDPIINHHNSIRSLRGFSELAAIGAAVRASAPFDERLVNGLRVDLGDWRHVEVDMTQLLDDPARRVGIYEEQGFNPELTDFPADGFQETLTVTGIELGSVEAELAPPPADWVPAFNTKAYQWLFVFEREIRKFIVMQLTEISQGRWESRLPHGMHERWQTKKAEALAKGESEQPIIHYADFTDYTDILLSRANWRECFQPIFKREESVREAFNRLRPIRLVTAHMRILTAEEWLVLNLEVRRFLRAINVF